jgi:ubiquinone/menaquinone biosynthesis C-methylase UbiE
MSTIPHPDTAVDRYASIYDGFAKSPTLRRIWATTYREDYPAEAEPYGFVTLTDLRRMAEALAIGPHDTFADVGCGRGGPGLWIARQTGASLIGIDASPAAIRHATARASEWGLQDRVRFQLGEFARTRLAGGMLAGAMSTDAFLFASDLPAACQEMARIIRAGGCFVFTSFELFKASTHFQLAPIHDYRPMLEVAGFTVEHYEETPDWERRMRMVFASIVAEEANLRREVGDVGAASFHQLATNRPKELSDTRRVLVVARRT